MTHTPKALWLPLLILLLGCGDEGPDDLAYGDLEGTWVPLSLVFTSDADPATTFDFLAAGGSGSLRFEPDTTFLLLVVSDPGSPTESVAGPVAVEGATVVLTDEADPDTHFLRGGLAEGRLVLETDDAEYDFDENGIDEAARLEAVFVRN